TAASVESARKWLEKSSAGFEGDEKHPQFPGFMSDRGFFSSLAYDSQWVAQITQSEVAEIQKPRLKREKFETLLALVDSKLQTLSANARPPQYIILCIPTELHEQWKVVKFRDPKLGDVHRDFHRAFKALAMRYRIPTQILRERTALWKDEDHYSKITWNFYTG